VGVDSTFEAELAAALAGHRALLIVAAHPDDDVLGAGALLTRTSKAVVVYVTDGAPRDGADARAYGFADPAAYATARRREAEAALACAGIPQGRTLHLGIPDQGATFALERATLALEEALARFAPGLVLTHPYEGGHSDHDATAFATRAALGRYHGGQSGAPPIVLGEFASYHAADGGVARGVFMPDPERPETVFPLDERTRRLKVEMLACHATQASVLAPFPLDPERFRCAPRYDFSRPPHPGPLLYERANSGASWGIDGPRWRAEAMAVSRRLGLTY
jgi:LmbE family N-acetylglucosaminyl deacetylase